MQKDVTIIGKNQKTGVDGDDAKEVQNGIIWSQNSTLLNQK